jgi:hypothetical protein
MEPGNSFLKPQANCRALMDGSEKCLKTSSCRALNALAWKDSEKRADLGAFGRAMSLSAGRDSGFSMLLQAIIPVAIMGHTFFPDEESMQKNHGCWQNH